MTTDSNDMSAKRAILRRNGWRIIDADDTRTILSNYGYKGGFIMHVQALLTLSCLLSVKDVEAATTQMQPPTRWEPYRITIPASLLHDRKAEAMRYALPGQIRLRGGLIAAIDPAKRAWPGYDAALDELRSLGVDVSDDKPAFQVAERLLDERLYPPIARPSVWDITQKLPAVRGGAAYKPAEFEADAKRLYLSLTGKATVHGWQIWLANEIGVSDRAIRHWIRGQRQLPGWAQVWVKMACKKS